MKVELIYFDGCPSYEKLLPRLDALLAANGATEALTLRRVETEDAAQDKRFLGSPTVRVDGDDVEPGARERTDYGLKCRLYRTADGLEPTPSDDWIVAAVERAQARPTRRRT